MVGSIHLAIDSAIQRLQQAIDLTVELQSLVQLGDRYSESQRESARGLSEEVLQSCRAAVSLLTAAAAGSPSSSSNNVAAGHRDPQPLLLGGTDEEGGDHHLATNCSWENITEAPYNDGYEWRKYGEKKISGSSFTRSYYRCTYSMDRRCRAKKQVQQQKHGCPSLYLVTYKGEHTCRHEEDEREQLRKENVKLEAIN